MKSGSYYDLWQSIIQKRHWQQSPALSKLKINFLFSKVFVPSWKTLHDHIECGKNNRMQVLWNNFACYTNSIRFEKNDFEHTEKMCWALVKFDAECSPVCLSPACIGINVGDCSIRLFLIDIPAWYSKSEPCKECNISKRRLSRHEKSTEVFE